MITYQKTIEEYGKTRMLTYHIPFRLTSDAFYDRLDISEIEAKEFLLESVYDLPILNSRCLSARYRHSATGKNYTIRVDVYDVVDIGE